MQKDTKILIGVLIITLILLGGMYLSFSRKGVDMSTTSIPSDTSESKPRDVVSEEEKRQLEQRQQEFEQRNPPESGAIQTATIEGKELAKGNFQKVEEGLIYYIDGNEHFASVLNKTDVVISCTTQDLASATELDFRQIQKVEIKNAGEIGGLIPVGETVVILSNQDANGQFIAHTIAMSADQCK